MSRPESLDIYCLVFLFYKDDTQQYIYLKYMYILIQMYTGLIENIPTSNIDIDPCCSGLPKTYPASSDLLLNAFTASRTGWKAFALTAAGLMEIERG